VKRFTTLARSERTTVHTPRTRRRLLLPAVVAALLAPLAVVAAGTTAAAAADCTDTAAHPWTDTSKTPEQRAQALLSASTQHQKYRWLVEQPANDPTRTTWPAAVTGGPAVVYPVQVECTPLVVYTDGPEGVRTAGATAFPAGISLASTWNPDLAYARYADQGAEAFDLRKNVILAPGVASGRTPLAGRTPEYFGEDPVLSGVLGAAGVRGIEDENPVLADVKHYTANEQELDRQTSSSNMDDRTFRQIYDLPFAIATKRGAAESVMCSFNQINHVYACENPVLNEALKEDAGFDGYVMSDFGSVHSTAASLMNGLDQELNRPIWFIPTRLDEALAAGQITQARIDEAAFRVVRSYIRGGLFDNPLPATAAAKASTDAHKATALEVAEQGSVLLQNDGALPLAPGAGGTIALIGPTASSTPTNGVSATSVCNLTLRFGAGTPRQSMPCTDLVSPQTAITDRAAADGATVTWDNGSDLASAAAAASAADVAVVFGYQRMGEFNDISDLKLQGGGDALVEAVAAANPNTVVVLQTGSAVEMPWADDVRAIVENWYGGEQMGPALANLLFGDTDFTGKLPMTFPRSLADTPTAGSVEQYPGVRGTDPAQPTIRQVEYSEGLQVGYRWYEAQGIDPLFAFGHGLSYTDFAYDHVNVTPTSTTGGQELRVRFRLTNTGDRVGTETPQVYVTLPSSAGEPFQRLVGWDQVTLAPGQFRNVEITLSPADLADLHLLQVWDSASDSWTTPKGTYQLSVGGSSDSTTGTTFRVR
jgi:beta-glucosidase